MMKDHELRELVNDITEIARKYSTHGCLRELLSKRIKESIHKD